MLIQVLENIVGHNVLPRGTGIVTRVPLVLQLHRPEEDEAAAAAAAGAGTEWAEFLHQPGVRYSDFSKVRTEIETKTLDLAGDNKGIVDKPIHLKVCSPSLLDLTLVDLPGITRVPVGDQPEDIEEQIRTLCLSYIENPNAIILAITAANTDVANSDSLQVAKQVDPAGDRTIGVLTKLDLMDPGTDASDILNNQVVPLKLGYVGVVNRGQRDVLNDVGVKDALVRERSFFASHAAYCTMTTSVGTDVLVARLAHLLNQQIKRILPALKKRVQVRCSRRFPLVPMCWSPCASLFMVPVSRSWSNLLKNLLPASFHVPPSRPPSLLRPNTTHGRVFSWRYSRNEVRWERPFRRQPSSAKPWISCHSSP